MTWFWHALWFCLVVIAVTLMWAVSIFDLVLRRGDLRSWQRLVWLTVVIFLPLLGGFVYACVVLGARQDRQINHRDLATLHSGGVLSGAEYQPQRERLEVYSRGPRPMFGPAEQPDAAMRQRNAAPHQAVR